MKGLWPSSGAVEKPHHKCQFKKKLYRPVVP